MELMRHDTVDSYGIKKLQNRILEVMFWIDKVCSENGIEYCLMGGSAIGAKRHGGFIPWDDDLDIFMTEQNYSKFRDLFVDNHRDCYYLQEWGKRDTMVSMAKVRMDGTAYIEELLQDFDIHQGIYVDIMVLHKCPKNILLQVVQYLCGRYVAAKGLADRGYNRRKDFGGMLLKILSLLPKGLGVKTALKNVYHYDSKNTAFYCNVLGKSNFQKSIYPVEWIEKPVYANFETIELKVPAEIEKYLNKRFGDYMKIPSAERIAWEQHSKMYSLDKDFREILKRNYRSFSDEDILI